MLMRNLRAGLRCYSDNASIEKRFKFGCMLAHQAGRGGGIFGASDITRSCGCRPALPIASSMRASTKLQAPWFLGSSWHQTISAFGKRSKLLRQHFVGERIELLEAQDLDAVFAALLALFHQIEIDLAGAQDHALDLVVRHELDGGGARHDFGLIAEDAMERRARPHVGEKRDAALVAQQRFRRHQDQRLAERPVHLTAQDVEIVGRRGGQATCILSCAQSCR